MGDNRPPVYYEQIEDRMVLVIRASAIGHPCLWELIAAGQGLEPTATPSWLQAAFDEGNDLEDEILAKTKDKLGLVYESHQDEGELWLSDDVVIRYHPDGLAYVTEVSVPMRIGAFPVIPIDRYVVEAKALSHALWTQAVKSGLESTIDEYAWQLSVMMHDTGRKGLWAALNKGGPRDEDGNREITDTTGKLYTQVVDEPLVSLEEIQLKASLIKLGVEGEDLLTSDRPCDSPDHFPCRFIHLRPEPDSSVSVKDADEQGSIRVLDDDSATAFNQAVRDYLSYKGQVDELKERLEEAKQRVLKTDDKAKRIITDRWSVPIVRGETSYLALEDMTQAERDTFLALKNKYTKKKPKAAYPGKIKRNDL